MKVLYSRLQAAPAFLVFGLCTPCPSHAAELTKAGVAATVKGTVEGVVGADRSRIDVGKDIFSDELVITDPVSATDLMFLDQTSLAITPGSQVTIDKFVYDPRRNRGSVVLDVTKGALRFVTGSQDPNSYQIKTPVATIGVRGTIVDFVVTPRGLAVTMENGAAVIIGSNGGVTTLTPAQALNVFGANGAVANAGNGRLAAAVGALLASSANPATTASSLLVIAGQNNTAGAADMTAVALAVSAANIPAPALQAAVSAAVVTSSDPATTAASIKLAATPLSPGVAQAATSGLAGAAVALQATNPTASAQVGQIVFPPASPGAPAVTLPQAMLAALRQAAQGGPASLATATASLASQNPALAAALSQAAAGIDPRAAAQIASAVVGAVNTIVTQQGESSIGPGTLGNSVTVAHQGNFVADLGVTYAATGQPLVRVTGSPGPGQYAVNDGVYVFNPADANVGMSINYTFSAVANGAPSAGQIAAAAAAAAPQFAARIAAVVAQSDPQAGAQVAASVAGAVPGSAAAVAAAVALELPQDAVQVAGSVANTVRNVPGASSPGLIAETVALTTGQQSAQLTGITDAVAAATSQSATVVSTAMQTNATQAAAVEAQVAAALTDLTPLITTPPKSSP